MGYVWPKLSRRFTLQKCIWLKFELDVSSMKIYVHVEEGGERNGNSDYTRKCDSLSTVLEEAILPFQETATPLPPATVCIPLSLEALRSIYILGFYITHIPPQLW